MRDASSEESDVKWRLANSNLVAVFEVLHLLPASSLLYPQRPSSRCPPKLTHADRTRSSSWQSTHIMSQPHIVLAALTRRTALTCSFARPPATVRASKTNASRHITLSSRSSAQVRDDVSQSTAGSSEKDALSASGSPTAQVEEPQKLGKRARRALKARQRHEDERKIKDERARLRSQAGSNDHNTAGGASLDPAFADDPPPIVKVKHVAGAANDKSTNAQYEQLNQRKSEARSSQGSDPTAGWSGSLFRSHISSLLSGFGTAPASRPLQENDFVQHKTSAPRSKPQPEPSPSADASFPNPSPSSSFKKSYPVTSPAMTKSERMESQARVIFQAIRDARERGIVDEDESFFYPYPEGVPPKDVEGKDAVWLNLGPDPEAWGKEIPQVKDKWLEVLSLGLAKEIVGRPAREATGSDGELQAELKQRIKDEYAFEDLVEDYDLEDHERLEQLGDSIVNMSSRLLAYLSYPDVNEGSLTRLSNYPTQNNFLALLFQECGLAARRDELRNELRRARDPGHEDEADGEGATKRQGTLGVAAETDEEKARLPSLIKRDADMFEAYAAAVFLSHGNDFNAVHEWLCHLFRPFQDQAYRFMVQRSEALAKMQANRAAAAAAAASAAAQASERDAASSPRRSSSNSSPPTNVSADGYGINSASVDPSSVPFSNLFPDFSRGSEKSPSAAIPTYALNNATEAFITDEFLTVAARARRQREERLRQELRLRDQQKLMNMGWFRKGFLNLSKGFRQYVMGKDVILEDEARLRQKVAEQRGMSEKDRQRLRAQERNAAGVSIKSTSSKKRHKIVGEERTQQSL